MTPCPSLALSSLPQNCPIMESQACQIKQLRHLEKLHSFSFHGLLQVYLFFKLLHYWCRQCCGSPLVSMRIRIQLFLSMQIRIQGFVIWWPKKFLKNLKLKKVCIFLSKIAIYFPCDCIKDVQTPGEFFIPQKIRNIQNFTTWNLSPFVGNFCPPGSGSSRPQLTQIHADPDPQYVPSNSILFSKAGQQNETLGHKVMNEYKV